jgi:hypothetical protein
MKFIFKTLVLAAAVSLAVKLYPDFQRYMRMRAM